MTKEELEKIIKQIENGESVKYVGNGVCIYTENFLLEHADNEMEYYKKKGEWGNE